VSDATDGPLPRRRVALVVVADVAAVTEADAAALAATTLRRALLAAPNLVRRGPLAQRPEPTLRHLVRDRADDARDVTFVTVTDARSALVANHVQLLPTGPSDPLPTEEDSP
jgi:hypothetical protein